MFSLVNGLSSTTSFGPPLPSFGCFVGTMPLYDSPALKRRASVHLGLIALRLLPAVRVRLPSDGSGVSRFSRVKFLCMLRVFDSAGHGVLAFSYAALLSSGWADTVDSLILPISELTTSGYLACICPFPTLQVRRCRRPRMVRGQDGSLLLSCMTLSFTTSRRFIPTLSSQDWLPHSAGFYVSEMNWPIDGTPCPFNRKSR